MLVHQKQDILEALKQFYLHLNAGGKLLIPLFIPTAIDIHTSAPKHNEWRLRREGQREDGKIIETEEENLILRWHTQSQFTNLLKNLGYVNIKYVSGYTDQPAKPNDEEFTFIASKPDYPKP